MLPCEQLAGITFESIGIDISRCSSGGKNCKTKCPKCSPTAHDPRKRDLSVDMDKGQFLCHNPGCEWKGGLILERREREGQRTAPAARKTPQMAPSTSTPPSVAPTPLESTAEAIPEDGVPCPSVELAPWATQWLDDRGIPESVASAFTVLSYGDNAVFFPYYIDNKLVNVKTRNVEPKRFFQSKPNVKCLYNLSWFQRNPTEGTVVICEGEMDVLSCAQAGWFNAVSVPDGAQAKPDTAGMRAFDEPTSAAVMASAKRIIIAVDNDAAGIAYKNALIERFGEDKTYVVQWPEGVKDANELLMRDGPDALDLALSRARPVDIPGIVDFHPVIETILGNYDGHYERGSSTGWPVLDQYWQWFPGMVYAITGIPGHGKTTFLTNALANAIYQHGWKVGLFSPEMGPHSSVLRKFTQVCADSPILPGEGIERLSREAIAHSAQWVSDRLFRVDAIRTDGENVAALTFDELMDRFTRLVVRSGINVAVIDPWIRIDAMRPRGFTETEWIANCLNKITRWSQRHQCAFVIVNHPRKQETGKSGEDEGWVSPYEMMGSSYWFALADFILAVKRNKYEPPLDHTFVRTWKVREEGWQGKLGIVEFTFNPHSQRFYDVNTQHPIGVGIGAYTDLPTHLLPDPSPNGGVLLRDVVPAMQSYFNSPAPWEMEAESIPF